mgnify:CR=1 FL=1
MWEKLKQLARRYDEIGELLEVPEIYADPKKLRALTREQKELSAVVETYRAYQKCEDDIVQALELVSDPELKDMAQEELNTAKAEKERLFDELRVLLLPRDPNDDKNVIVEIRGGVGGEESALFAADLYRMYAMYAEKRGYRVELLNYNDTELGGVKEADFMVNGDGAYSRFKFESGVHRVQRVPETESGGRVHTSTATVAVLPEMEEVDVDLRPEDIEMQARAASTSTRRALPCASSISRRASSFRVRRSAPSSRTAPSVWRCSRASSTRLSASAWRVRSRASAARRSAAACATSASAPITSRKTA